MALRRLARAAVAEGRVTPELARARAPELVGRIGVNLAGPTLLAHGSVEQKTRSAADGRVPRGFPTTN